MHVGLLSANRERAGDSVSKFLSVKPVDISDKMFGHFPAVCGNETANFSQPIS